MPKTKLSYLIAVILLVALACNLPTAANPTLTLVPTPLPQATIDTKALLTENARVPVLSVEQIVVRYDILKTNGNLEALVCNWGSQPSTPFDFELEVNGVVAAGKYAEQIAPEMCAVLYDDTMDLPAFGVASPQTILASARLISVKSNGTNSNLSLQANLNVQVIEVPPSIPGNLYPDEYPLRQDPHEILINVNEYWVLVPASHEVIANWAMWDIQNCSAALSEYFATASPSWVAQSYLFDDDSSGGYFGFGAGMFTTGDLSLADYFVGMLPKFFDDARLGYCNNSHEMTHLILGQPPVPGWLNEGLATYMSDPQRAWVPDGESIECREAGWFGSDFNGDVREVPFEDLMTYDPDNTPGIHYYYTGSCFWDYIEVTYGHEALQKIVQQAVAASDDKFSGCSSALNDLLFIRDIVNPVVGEDVSPVTLERWGFDASYNGCEDQGF